MPCRSGQHPSKAGKQSKKGVFFMYNVWYTSPVSVALILSIPILVSPNHHSYLGLSTRIFEEDHGPPITCQIIYSTRYTFERNLQIWHRDTLRKIRRHARTRHPKELPEQAAPRLKSVKALHPKHHVIYAYHSVVAQVKRLACPYLSC